MIDAINNKILSLYARLVTANEDERGQTTTEYVAVTAIGVGLAVGVAYVLLKGAITSAIQDIATQLTSAIPFS